MISAWHVLNRVNLPPAIRVDLSRLINNVAFQENAALIGTNPDSNKRAQQTRAWKDRGRLILESPASHLIDTFALNVSHGASEAECIQVIGEELAELLDLQMRRLPSSFKRAVSLTVLPFMIAGALEQMTVEHAGHDQSGLTGFGATRSRALPQDLFHLVANPDWYTSIPQKPGVVENATHYEFCERGLKIRVPHGLRATAMRFYDLLQQAGAKPTESVDLVLSRKLSLGTVRDAIFNPVARGQHSLHRAKKLAALESGEQQGQLTKSERRDLAEMRTEIRSALVESTPA